MIRLILVGLTAGLFFSSTFILNRVMSLEGGHWIWSASLRYGYMILFLVAWFLLFKGPGELKKVLQVFLKNIGFWTLAGTVGFGLFYALICYSADHAPGWVVATTWQFTIIATLFVLLFFGRTFPKKTWLFSAIVFGGVLMVNLNQAESTNLSALLAGVLPVLVAAFCYPLGNQMVWEATNGNPKLPDVSSPVLDTPFARVLLMSLGSLPLWLLLIVATTPPLPSAGQLLNTALVALFSGVAATSLFLQARNLSKTAGELAAVDATQSSEVVFALLGEIVIVGAAFPDIFSVFGIGITCTGI
ncbi:MAG: multidrug resistance efflux transporter family protein, partial [Desulfobacterales bacterium]|nr:multidrug resistance efflux transporter family protein [Desulfobacterales bacterium]